jgi:elongation factor 3
LTFDRYSEGHDKEQSHKATRALTEEDKKMLEIPIKATTGEERTLEAILGRQKLKKSYTYEIKFKNYDHKYNVWIPRERLLELGFGKLVMQVSFLKKISQNVDVSDAMDFD